MAIEVRCSYCGKSILVVDTMAGTYGKCHCGNPVYIPQQVDASADLDPASRASSPSSSAEPALDPLEELFNEELAPAAAKESAFEPWSRSSSAPGDAAQRKKKDLPMSVGRGARRGADWLFKVLKPAAAAAVALLLLIGFMLAEDRSFYLSAGLAVTGVTLCVVGNLLIMIIAFRESPVYWLLIMFVPFFGFYYIITRLDDTWKPFLAAAGGLLMVFVTAPGAILSAGRLRLPDLPAVQADNPYDLDRIERVTMGPRESETAHEEYYHYQVKLGEETAHVHLPVGIEGPFPWVLLASGGNTVMGRQATTGEIAIAPYIRHGFAVVSFSIPGFVHQSTVMKAEGDPQLEEEVLLGIATFFLDDAGMKTARRIVDTLPQHEPALAADQLYVGGHSAGGTTALLFAASEPRVRGCFAYAPICDLEQSIGAETIEEFDARLSGLGNHIRRSSPARHLAGINCPVFLFHAHDDRQAPFRQTDQFARALAAQGKIVETEFVQRGGHHEAVNRRGIRIGAQWLAGQVSESTGVWPGGALLQKSLARAVQRPGDESQVDLFDTSRAPYLFGDGCEWNWNAAVQPQAAATMEVVADRIRLRSQLHQISDVQFRGERLVVANRWGNPFQRPRDDPAVWLDTYDSATGAHFQRVALDKDREVRGVDADGQRALVTRGAITEIWSLDDGSLQVAWTATTATSIRSAYFVGPDHVVTVANDNRLIAWSLPKRQAVLVMDNIIVVTPVTDGRRLIACDWVRASSPTYLLDVQAGTIVGEFKGRRFGAAPRQWAQSADGRLAAFSQKDEVVVWNLQNGATVVSAKALRPAAEGMQFLGEDYLNVSGQLLDIRSSKVRWNYKPPKNSRFWESGRKDGKLGVWLTAARAYGDPADLIFVNMPDDQVAGGLLAGNLRMAGSTDLSTDLYERKTTTPDDETTLTSPTQFEAPSLVADDPSLFTKALKSYRRAAMANLLLRPDDTLVEQMKYDPFRNVPSVGLRWSVAFNSLDEEVQPQVGTVDDLAKLIGAVGTTLYEGLQDRNNDGRFGYWPDIGNAKLSSVPIWSGGGRSSFLARAQQENTPFLLYITLAKKSTDHSLVLRIVGTDREENLWASDVLSLRRLQAAGRSQAHKMMQALAADALQEIDDKYILRPMPDLTPQQAAARAGRLARDPGAEPLMALIEIRYYVAKNLITVDAAADYIDDILGAGAGRTVISGSSGQRFAILKSLVESAD